MALWLTGCFGSDGPVHLDPKATVHLDPNFTAEQSEAIVAALDEWQIATAGLVHLRVVIGGGRYGTSITRKDLEENYYGRAYRFRDRAPFIALDVDDITRLESASKALQNVVMHELGHAFGLDHAEEGLMFRYVSSQDCLDALTLSSFCALHHCPAEARATCAAGPTVAVP